MVLLKCASVSLFVYRVMRDPSGFIPSPMDRYRQILLPTLRLFQVILTSTTMNHQQGAAQVSTQMIILQKCKCHGSLLSKHCTCILMFSYSVCLQVLQWLIVHADTIQSLLRCQELSMGVLQELSLLTGIISKTALPGTMNNSLIFLFTLYCISPFPSCTPHIHM